MATYFIVRVPGVVPPNITRILKKALVSRVLVTAPQAEVQVWSGPTFDRHWTNIEGKIIADHVINPPSDYHRR